MREMYVGCSRESFLRNWFQSFNRERRRLGFEMLGSVNISFSPVVVLRWRGVVLKGKRVPKVLKVVVGT